MIVNIYKLFNNNYLTGLLLWLWDCLIQKVAFCFFWIRQISLNVVRARQMPPIFRLILILTIPLSIAGCNGERVEELESQLEDVRSKLSDAESEVNSLKSAVGEFEYSNWRIVVSNVQSAASDVESAADNVEPSVGDAVSAAQ